MSLLHILSALLWLAILASAGCDRAPNKTATAAPSSPANPSTNTAAVVPVNNNREPRATKNAPIVETTFNDLKFEMEKTERFERKMLTPQIEELLGRSIRIRGYIYPTPKRRGIKQFVLVRDNLECCFGPGAAIYDCILIHMEPGHTAEYSIRPVAVEGTLRLEEIIGPDGRHLVIYHMAARKVQ